MPASIELRQTFSPVPELEQRSAPRDVALTTGGRMLVLAAWLLAAGAPAAGVALHEAARRQSNAASDIDRRGVTASAVVDRLWRSSGDGKPAFAAFHFDAGDIRIDGESRLQPQAWRELRAGSTVPVRYLPDNPARFVVAGERRNRLPFALAYVVAFTLAALALLCAASLRWQRALLSEGRPARAVVKAVRKRHGTHGGTHREMVYEFPLLAGGVATGKASASKSAEVGATLTVVYDPEQPTRNRPYPFSLVTLDRG